MKIRTFYHYSKFIDEIKKDGWLLATSFAKTYTYDWVIETYPNLLLNKKEIQKLKAYQKQNKKTIQLYKREQLNEENYESCYRDIKLKFKNKLLNEFFNNEGYVLAFSDKFQEGWTNKNSKKHGVFDIFKKTGNKYIKFTINDKIAKRCYVLEQKFWNEEYHKPILEKKYGKDFERLEKAFEQDVFHDKKCKLKNYKEFKKDFVEIMFFRYYNSIVRLKDYKGNFEIAEFWIGEDIPVSICEFGEVSFKEMKKMTGLSKKHIVTRKITNADISERKKKKSKSSIAIRGK